MKIDEIENFNSNYYFKVAIGPKYAKEDRKIQILWKDGQWRFKLRQL